MGRKSINNKIGQAKGTIIITPIDKIILLKKSYITTVAINKNIIIAIGMYIIVIISQIVSVIFKSYIKLLVTY